MINHGKWIRDSRSKPEGLFDGHLNSRSNPNKALELEFFFFFLRGAWLLRHGWIDIVLWLSLIFSDIMCFGQKETWVIYVKNKNIYQVIEWCSLNTSLILIYLHFNFHWNVHCYILNTLICINRWSNGKVSYIHHFSTESEKSEKGYSKFFFPLHLYVY